MRSGKNKWLVAGLLLFAGLLTTVPASGAGFQIGDERTFLKFGLLLQGWADFNEDKAPDAESWETELYLRRIRILMAGQLNEKVNFFVETDSPNFGKAGDFTVRAMIQDAWIEFNLCEGFQLDVGQLLVPFSHNGMQGAVSLHSLDYHSALIKYPAGSTIVWRDFGLMVRGLLLNQLIEYRLAVLNGVRGKVDPDPAKADPRNPHDVPRLSARLTLNLFDAEASAGIAGFFYKGVYLRKTDAGIESAKKILSLGASADWQKDLNAAADGGRDDYFAVNGDIFWDMALSEDKLLGLAGQVNFYYYNHGETSESTGMGLLSELGLRYDAYEALVNLDWFDATETEEAGDTLAIYGGFNWWYLGHGASVKLQAGAAKRNGGDFGLFAQLQAQLLMF